jgi:3alpha(or 20beta)-hydroxysteroid dehydrogenase
MGRLLGKVALVTGAGRGHGAAVARLFLSEGARVALADIDPPAVDPDLVADDTLSLSLDVRDLTAWTAAVDGVLARWDRLDVLVNNAGIMRPGRIEDQSPEEFMDLVAVNQLGTWLGMKTAIGPMRRGGGGSIVNISSVGGLVGVPGNSAYGASKWAVRGMTKSAALELAGDQIRVNSVHPGAIATQMPVDAGYADARASIGPRIPLGRIAEVEDVARVVLFLASDDSSYCTGSEFVVDGGMSAD